MPTELWPVRPIAWHKAETNETFRRLYHILLKWIPFADLQYAEWPDRPECGHFFGGAYWYGLETAYTASVYALAAKLGEYDETVTGISREEIKAKAVRAIRYLGFTHDTGPEDCVRAEGRNKFCSKTKWGGRGQKFFPASQTGVTVASFGLSAWLLWEELDAETRGLVQNVLADYADRWSAEEPRNGVYHDTQSEENAWTAGGIAAALGVFAEHPNLERWRNAFEAWSLHAVTTGTDRVAEQGPRTGTPLKRVKTTTFHPDFTTENHGFAHPSYICAGINLRGVHAVYALMGAQPISDTIRYNNVPLYERTIKVWAQFDGLAIPWQGQDWWYNRQHERLVTHALMNVLHEDRDAACFEQGALRTIEGIQNGHPSGCLLEENGEQCFITGYQTAKDMEHTSAKDLVITCLLHAFGGPGAEPSEPSEMAERLSGVYLYSFGGTVIHRTARSASGFNWRNRVMALTVPEQGVWCVTPLTASYTGTMAFDGGPERNVLAQERFALQTETENIRVYENGFGASASLIRGDDELRQEVAFVSLPNGATVYAERFHVLKPCSVTELHTGIIGVRNERCSAMPELARGCRTLHLPRQADTFEGFFGREPNRTADYPAAAWVNVDDRIGYIPLGSGGIRYVNQHEYPKWKGVEDVLILNRRAGLEFEDPQTLSPFALVTLPNRTKEETSASAEKTSLWKCDSEEAMLLETEDCLVAVNFERRGQNVRAAKKQSGRMLSLYEGVNFFEESSQEWNGRLEPFTSCFYSCSCKAEILSSEPFSLEAAVLPDRLYLINRKDQTVHLKLHTQGGISQDITMKAGEARTIPLMQEVFI